MLHTLYTILLAWDPRGTSWDPEGFMMILASRQCRDARTV
jgi:hypothetical protein